MTDPEDITQQVLLLWYHYDLDHGQLLWYPDDSGRIVFSVDCSAVFAWGEADSELITQQNLNTLAAQLQQAKEAGHFEYGSVLDLWCCEQRSQRPMQLAWVIWPRWAQEEVMRRWPIQGSPST